MDEEKVITVDKVMGEQDLLRQDTIKKLIESNEKRTFYARITGIAAVIICLVFVIAGCVLIPKAARILNKANDTIVKAEDSLANIDKLTAGLLNTSDNMNKVLNDNAEGLKDALDDLKSIDIETLNKAIGDLHDTVEPMAKFFNAFK
ncbi:MAG: hypothetical protein IKY04_07510 [Lachnospiraceae bacterium]|nr:hypothetical protein [Lachnospiraceae bacterium]MBR4994083.1 hypothetical protein [Lachnospiraceae bacterium]